MDHSQEIKKQRNAKIQRDKRRKPSHKTDSGKVGQQFDSENVSSPDTAPQPQRTNRRQGNESVPKSNPAAEVTTKEATGEVKEKIVIDHSNLKRETEEIAKLTKKFSRREITSNWHRYSAHTDPRAEVGEEEGPADFSDLLQVPVSRGGHLQLKEEQGWSSVTPRSRQDPRGLWALDLRQLSSSLACIPTHECLGLPQDKLSKEEIQLYVFLAEEAKKCYNADEFTDSVDEITNKEKPFNILDVNRSTNALLNMNEGVEISSHQNSNNIDILKRIDSNLNNEETLNFKENRLVEEIQEPLKINNLLNFKDLDSKYETRSLDEVVPETKKQSHPKLEVFPEDREDNKSVIKTQPLIEKLPDQIEKTLTNNQPCSDVKLTDPIKSNILNSNVETNENFTINYEIKEKRPNRTKSRNSPMKEEVVSKTLDKVNDIKLEDDDDLDFLLSLKKPVTAEKEVESKAGTLKDSSFLPGEAVAPSTTQVQQSDLDDWLDSVLQD